MHKDSPLGAFAEFFDDFNEFAVQGGDRDLVEGYHRALQLVLGVQGIVLEAVQDQDDVGLGIPQDHLGQGRVAERGLGAPHGPVQVVHGVGLGDDEQAGQV